MWLTNGFYKLFLGGGMYLGPLRGIYEVVLFVAKLTLSKWRWKITFEPSLIAVNKHFEKIFYLNCIVLHVSYAIIPLKLRHDYVNNKS